MCEFLLQHGADVNSSDSVSYCCQLFYLLLIMVQVCVVPNNLQVACWSKVLYRFTVYLYTGPYSQWNFKENLNESLKVHTCPSEA